MAILYDHGVDNRADDRADDGDENRKTWINGCKILLPKLLVHHCCCFP